MNFDETEKIDVTKHVEKKGKFSYLSWPFAVSEFRKVCPNGTWRISVFGDNRQPYCQSESGCFVIVDVIPDIDHKGLFYSQVHPVLDNSNKTIATPNAFQINTSIQRCLVKAIALATGIGLHIYAGEDLPPGADEKQEEDSAHTKAFDEKTLTGWMNTVEDAAQNLTIEQYRVFYKGIAQDVKTDCGKREKEVADLFLKLGKKKAEAA